MDNTLLSLQQVAELLNISRATARRMMLEGVLPVVTIRSGKRKKLLRCRREAILNWIKKNEK